MARFFILTPNPTLIFSIIVMTFDCVIFTTYSKLNNIFFFSLRLYLTEKIFCQLLKLFLLQEGSLYSEHIKGNKVYHGNYGKVHAVCHTLTIKTLSIASLWLNGT